MNIAAEELGIDPIDLRIKNAQVSGDEIPDVATISSCGFIDTIKAVAEMSGWKEKRKHLKPGQGIGIGCYSFISGGVFNWFNTEYPFSAAEVRAFAMAPFICLPWPPISDKAPIRYSNRSLRRNWG